MVWRFHMLVVQAARIPSQSTAIPLIAFEDADQGDGIKLVAGEIENIQFIGREVVEVLNQKIKAYKFSDKSAKEETLYWLSDSGLLLKITTADFSMVLTGYQGP
jgi:hypothetical protein